MTLIRHIGTVLGLGKDRESLEQFWGALAEMAKKCDTSSGEEESIHYFFIINKKNYEIQRNLSTANLPPPPLQEALNVALVDEKGISNQLKMTRSCKSPNPVNNTAANVYRITKKEVQLCLTVSTRSAVFCSIY